MGNRKRAAREVKAAELMDDSMVIDARWRIRVESPHRWFDSDKGRVLTARRSSESRTRFYKPEEAHGAFIRFAALEPTEEAFRGFADEYGPLSGTGWVPGGETWDAWRDAHRRVASAVRLWESAKRGQECDCLAIEPAGRHQAFWTLHEIGDPSAHLDFGTLFGDTESDEGDLRVTLGLVLADVISNQLRARVSPRLVWHEGRARPVFKISPVTMLGLLWWQLGRTVVGEVDYRPCKVCGKPIEIGSGAFTKARELCSPACTQRDHRARVRRAKELKGQGRTVKQIAKELDTDTEVITNWLTKKK